MSTHLVTGRAGRPHVSAEDIGAKDSGVFGAENYVLETGNQFACVIINNNLIRIKDGDLIMQGRHVRVEGYEEVVIENGQLAVKRQDLIVMRYEMDANTGLETAYFAVIKGTSGNEPEEPEYERGSISEGDIIVDFPLYKILLEGTNITSIETLFSVLMPMAKYQEQVMAMEKVIEDQQKELTELNGKYIVAEIPVTIPAHNAGYYGYVIGKHNHIPEGYTPELWCWWTGSLAASNGMQVSVTSITLNEYGLIIYAPITTAIVNGGINVLCKKA